MASMIDQQHKLLPKIAKELASTTIGRRYHLSELNRGDAFARQQQWAQNVPLFTSAGWQQYLQQQVNEPNANPADILNRPGFVRRNAAKNVAFSGDLAYPQDGNLVKTALQTEKNMLAQLKKMGLTLNGKHLHIALSAPQGQPSLEHQILSQRGPLSNTIPSAQQAAGFGKTRYQQLNAYAEVLEQQGQQITHITARPSDLAELSFILAQRAARLVNAKELCPNLVAYIALGPTLLPERYEIAHFFSSLNVRWVQAIREAFGLIGWQDDINLRGVLCIPEDLPTYLEFIPQEDLLPNGQPKRDFRRLGVADLQPGQHYVLVTSSAQGWLGLNTQWLVKVHTTQPLRLSYRGHTQRFTPSSMILDREELNRTIDDLNQALGGFSMFVRDFWLGWSKTDSCLHWVMELNRPTSAVEEKLLQSLGTRLHSELALNNSFYQQATNNAAHVGKIHFIPIGTLATLPESTPVGPFDTTPELSIIGNILQRAYEPRTIEIAVV